MFNITPVFPKVVVVISGSSVTSFPSKLHWIANGLSPPTTTHGTVTRYPALRGLSPKVKGRTSGGAGIRNYNHTHRYDLQVCFQYSEVCKTCFFAEHNDSKYSNFSSTGHFDELTFTYKILKISFEYCRSSNTTTKLRFIRFTCSTLTNHRKL